MRAIKDWETKKEFDWNCWLQFNNWYGDNVSLSDLKNYAVGDLMEKAFFAGFNARDKIEEEKK